MATHVHARALSLGRADAAAPSDWEAADAAVEPLLAERHYQDALDELAKLRGPVDAFFEHVMVNSENPKERQNRYRLLNRLRQLFTQLADLALLATAE